MKVKHPKGSNLVQFELTNRFFTNKLKSILSYSGKLIQRMLSEKIQRKKIKDVLIIYKWGKSKEKGYINKKGELKRIPTYYFTSELYTNISDTVRITQKSLLKYTVENLEINYERFQREFSDTSEAHPLRGITFKFLYE